MKIDRSLKYFFFLWVSYSIFCVSAQAQDTQARPCGFHMDTLVFGGSSLEQARCLLRKVKVGADLEPQTLPKLLEKIVDQPVPVSKEALRAYLQANKISENEVGGSLDAPISRGRSNNKDAPFARYFVIHDTSSPNLCEVNSFPANINDAGWIWNGTKWNDRQSSRYAKSENAHLYIMRDGASIAPKNRTFGTPWRATKLENTDVRSRGMFLHIENVQPRHCSPKLIASGKCKNSKGECNDNIAPDIGFSEAQIERLALVYIAASVRRGKWMIPAFHAALDVGISDGHDDPQNFDLQKWAGEICSLLGKLGAVCSK